MKKYTLFLATIVVLFLMCTGCQNDRISIIGNVEENLEIYTEFIDPGVTLPQNYTLIVDGKIDNTSLGKQKITYLVYDTNGELVKELHRFVNVIDSTPPTYTEVATINETEFYVGEKYNISHFIANYQDNYISKHEILVTPSEFIFDKPGSTQIVIDFIDSLGNKSTFTTIINVITDQTAPTFISASNTDSIDFHVGQTYDLSCFISAYSDNLASIEEITVIPSSFIFTDPGTQDITIDFIDTFGNKSTFSKQIIVKEVDFEALINEIYRDQTQKVSSTTTSMGSKYIHVSIDTNTSLGYFDTGSLHYLKSIETILGSNASIQISANYGEFNKANISFHIRASNGKYSAGFATINATQTQVVVTEFRLSINNLNLEEEKVLEELNANINDVLASFQDYMNNTLHIKVK